MFNDFITVTMVLFAVIDILGSIPLIISLRQKVGHVQSKKATLVALVIMVVFLFTGEKLLGLLGVDVNSFAVAGSLVLFFLAIEMILGIRIYKEENPDTASIIPIAFPLIAGAGTLTTIISLRAEYEYTIILAGILVNSLLVYIVLKNTERLEKLFGNSGLGILRKSFGIVLLAISIRLFTQNIKLLF
ncbi:MarC family protein [Schleiferia thermophila]|jgi:multiple antibiotic resistance protein|uniref:UPF0056 membrane protein n=1 Tax=Schleiferia thermophila TaxID=884107 RepID=A0A369A862_9FLAO|nr:MarC family protein [Schleiferia thermophila]RCX05311.1 multiple antibiotic resistance protein [Schleiferia thermophila]GCD79181.1 UPF0056 inner membrane protein [Schleiferia thermophila]